MNYDLKKVIEIIENSNEILILTHISPDGDALGSSYALKKCLDYMGKASNILLEEELPSIYTYFEKDIFITKEVDFSKYDLVICVDCGDIKRLGVFKDRIKDKNTINIDHHYSNTEFANFNYVNSSSAATGEIIYELCAMVTNDNLTKEMANGIYTAILTDTGGFMFSNTTSITHEIAGKLISLGADFYLINKKMLEEKDYKKHMLSALIIKNMKFYFNNKFNLVKLNFETLQELEINSEDLNGLSSLPRSVTGVEVSALVTELKKGEIKASLRSDLYVDVSIIASNFDGGGHVRASGFSVHDDLDKVCNKLITLVENEI